MTKSKVAIIDDDVWMGDLIGKELRSAGFDVATAKDADEGIDLIDKYSPNVIVLDFFMPGPNAIALLHELQSYTDTSQIPIVLCTNNASRMKLKTLRPYGVRALLDKTTMIPGDILSATRRVIA